MEKTVFVYDGKEFETLKAIAEYRGVKQVARRDMERLGIKEITKAEEAPAEAPKAEESDNKAKAVEPTAEATDKEAEGSPTEEAGLDKDDILDAVYPNREAEEDEEADTADSEEEVSEPEADNAPDTDNADTADSKTVSKKGKVSKKEMNQADIEKAEKLRKEMGYATIEELAQDLKARSAEEVITMAKNLGLSWREDAHVGINRMRAAMEIRKALFPGERRPRPPKSGWKNFSYEEMVAIAKKHKLTFKETIDDKINRMWVIKALKDAGITPPQK